MKPSAFIEKHYDEIRSALIETNRMLCAGQPSAKEFEKHLAGNREAAVIFESTLGDQLIVAALDSEYERRAAVEDRLAKDMSKAFECIREIQLRLGIGEHA